MVRVAAGLALTIYFPEPDAGKNIVLGEQYLREL
jgi:hypothetical protein